MPAKERRKVQYLAVEQGLFDQERFENTEMLFELQGLKTMTLVMEKSQETKGELTLFREPEDSDSTIIQWEFDDYEEEELWPYETKRWMEDRMEVVGEDHICGVWAPRLEFKVLSTAS